MLAKPLEPLLPPKGRSPLTGGLAVRQKRRTDAAAAQAGRAARKVQQVAALDLGDAAFSSTQQLQRDDAPPAALISPPQRRKRRVSSLMQRLQRQRQTLEEKENGGQQAQQYEGEGAGVENEAPHELPAPQQVRQDKGALQQQQPQASPARPVLGLWQASAASEPSVDRLAASPSKALGRDGMQRTPQPPKQGATLHSPAVLALSGAGQPKNQDRQQQPQQQRGSTPAWEGFATPATAGLSAAATRPAGGGGGGGLRGRSQTPRATLGGAAGPWQGAPKLSPLSAPAASAAAAAGARRLASATLTPPAGWRGAAATPVPRSTGPFSVGPPPSGMEARAGGLTVAAALSALRKTASTARRPGGRRSGSIGSGDGGPSAALFGEEPVEAAGPSSALTLGSHGHGSRGGLPHQDGSPMPPAIPARPNTAGRVAQHANSSCGTADTFSFGAPQGASADRRPGATGGGNADATRNAGTPNLNRKWQAGMDEEAARCGATPAGRSGSGVGSDAIEVDGIFAAAQLPGLNTDRSMRTLEACLRAGAVSGARAPSSSSLPRGEVERERVPHTPATRRSQRLSPPPPPALCAPEILGSGRTPNDALGQASGHPAHQAAGQQQEQQRQQQTPQVCHPNGADDAPRSSSSGPLSSGSKRQLAPPLTGLKLPRIKRPAVEGQQHAEQQPQQQPPQHQLDEPSDQDMADGEPGVEEDAPNQAQNRSQAAAANQLPAARPRQPAARRATKAAKRTAAATKGSGSPASGGRAAASCSAAAAAAPARRGRGPAAAAAAGSIAGPRSRPMLLCCSAVALSVSELAEAATRRLPGGARMCVQVRRPVICAVRSFAPITRSTACTSPRQ